MMIESLGTALAIHLLTHHSSKRTASREYGAMPSHLLRRAVEFIHHNLTRNLSLFELASEVDMSPYHFCRLFKRSTGLSPHQYLQRERIRRARDLLAEHRLTVAEVAGELGFSDQSHFARTFSRSVGATPRDYANAHSRASGDCSAPDAKKSKLRKNRRKIAPIF
ncbi:helix-turn-helix domain-containing protein [Candidatus Binatus sp.]|uniref:helix-turn-helix domain-containing protein n=1 Tax=Candidatus Binatus sp. TaxID=2811406 RepID=UPI00272CF3A8|nr:AraC family transcriptional regulator [Candidatus Binatus sp.]